MDVPQWAYLFKRREVVIPIFGGLIDDLKDKMHTCAVGAACNLTSLA